jgi:hypothetical protein
MAPTQPFWAALGTTRVTQQTGKLNERSRTLAVNSKSVGKVNSMQPLGFEPVIFGMLALAHLSDHSALSPTPDFHLMRLVIGVTSNAFLINILRQWEAVKESKRKTVRFTPTDTQSIHTGRLGTLY